MTKLEALERSLELWQWCAETGKEKMEWPEWKNKYNGLDRPECDCFLCEWIMFDSHYGAFFCWKACPIVWTENRGDRCDMSFDSPYCRWEHAETDDDRKPFAAEIVKLLEEAIKRIKQVQL